MTDQGFDTVIIVDWSAASKPSAARPSANAVWIGVAGASEAEPTYHRTRRAAVAALTARLDACAAAGERVLLGFDFPMGYPQGFAKRLVGRSGAAGVWDWLARHVIDTDDNANNRFDVAQSVNLLFGGAGPFWGRPSSLMLPHLSECKTVDYLALGLEERRRVEKAIPRAQSVWKLFTTGSVGSQAIMGLPYVDTIARRPNTAVWPFQSSRGAALVIAEIYPSLVDPMVRRAVAAGAIKDAAQVQLLARAIWRLGRGRPELALMMRDVPDWAGRSDEGWILGAGHAAALNGALE